MGPKLMMILAFLLLPGENSSTGLKAETIEHPEAEAKQGWQIPCDTIIGRMQDFLPGYMEEKQIPGCAISLICEHRMVWTEGFGSRNALTRKPVDRETVFEVASISKMITSFVALLLVEKGKLGLDTPLSNYLSTQWLPESEYRDLITMRHVLTHTSGLGHNDMSREILFPPGSSYQYSNLGFTYLQQVLEQLSGKPLEELASVLVFERADMPHTSYINRKELRPMLANGHVTGSYLLVISGIFFLITLLVLWVPGLLIFRLTKKRWLPEKRIIIYGLLLTVVLWLVLTFTFFGMIGWLKYAWQMALFGITFLGVTVLLILGGRALLKRLSSLSRQSIRILLLVWMLVVIFGLTALTRSIHNIPVPGWPAMRAMAPASLRTTAGDMASFLLEISIPGYAGISVSDRMLEPQVRLHPEISWGLGAGIFHNPQGDALWQWGQNVDFQSLVIYWPQQGTGMVVLTNGDWGEPDVAMEIAQRALGVSLEAVIRASHLEFSGELASE